MLVIVEVKIESIFVCRIEGGHSTTKNLHVGRVGRVAAGIGEVLPAGLNQQRAWGYEGEVIGGINIFAHVTVLPEPTRVVAIIELHPKVGRIACGNYHGKSWIQATGDGSYIAPHRHSTEDYAVGVNIRQGKKVIQSVRSIPTTLTIFFPVGIKSAGLDCRVRSVAMIRVVAAGIVGVQAGAIGEGPVRDIEGKHDEAAAGEGIAIPIKLRIGIHHFPATTIVTVYGKQGGVFATCGRRPVWRGQIRVAGTGYG